MTAIHDRPARAAASRRRAPSLSASLLAACLGSACSSEVPGTATLVVVDSDLTLGSELAHVDVAVYAADGRGPMLGGRGFDVAASPAPAGAYPLPLSFAVAPQGGKSSRSFRVVVRGLSAVSGAPGVRADAIGAFVPGELRRLDVFLARSCRDVICQSDASGAALTTCVAGACVAVPTSSGVPVATGDDLGGYVSSVLGADGGRPDGSVAVPDASPPGDRDAGPITSDAGGGAPDAASDASTGDAAVLDDGAVDAASDAGPCVPPTSCPPGSAAGPCGCIDIDECAEPAAQAVCAPTGYACAETLAPGYTCLGHRADWPMPDVLAGSVAAPAYSASGNGENGLVLDRVTGLVWQMRPGRSDGALVPSYAQAAAICAGTSTGGLSFRVPSLIELVSILDPARGAAGVSNLLADRTYFQGVAGLYWTSTPDPLSPSQQRLVSFLDASLHAGSSTVTTARVRCVASPTPVPSGTPATRLVPFAANGEVVAYVDQRTRLGWASAVSPAPVDYAGAQAYCADLRSSYGAGTRLPSYKELLTALRLGQASPYWDAPLSTPLGPFWSATPVASDATRAYLVDFATATAGSAPTTTLAYARCAAAVPPP